MPLPPLASWWTWLFGALGVLASAIGFAVALWRWRRRIEITQVAIVDETVEIHHVQGVKCPVVEFTVKNASSRTIEITGVEVDVHRIWFLMRQDPLGFKLLPSGTYEVKIDPARDAPYRLQAPLSQALKEKDIDRFNIRFLLEPMKPFEQIYALTLRLVIDQRRWAPPVDVILTMPDMSAGQNPPGYLL